MIYMYNDYVYMGVSSSFQAAQKGLLPGIQQLVTHWGWQDTKNLVC